MRYCNKFQFLNHQDLKLCLLINPLQVHVMKGRKFVLVKNLKIKIELWYLKTLLQAKLNQMLHSYRYPHLMKKQANTKTRDFQLKTLIKCQANQLYLNRTPNKKNVHQQQTMTVDCRITKISPLQLKFKTIHR